MSAPGPELLARLRDREADMVALLERLALVETPSSSRDAQFAVLDLLARELEPLGFRMRLMREPGENPCLLGIPNERDRGAPRQLLLGHADTVWPLGTLRQMPVRTVGGRVHGPGVFDMKAGLVQLVFALRALREQDLRLPAVPVVFVNTDEEIGSPGSTRWIRLLAAGAARAFVLEPAAGPAGELKTCRKGVGRFRLRVRGRSSHAGSDPSEGVSAIRELAHQVERLFELNDPERGVTVNVGAIDGGARPNVVAAEASAVVDVRVATHADADAVERALRGLRPRSEGTALALEGRFGRPPMEMTERNRALGETARREAARLGLTLSEAPLVGGASDGNTTSLVTATLDGLGAVGDGAHATHEYVDAARMPERAALLAALLAAPLADRRARPPGRAPARPRRSLAGAVYGSVTRVAELERRATTLVPVPRSEWATGDLVVGRLERGESAIESTSGRAVEALAGDLVVGALGRRAATLEATGDWEEIGTDGLMHGLTRSGVFGRLTSAAPAAALLVASYRYEGHVFVKGRLARMHDFAAHEPERPFETPTVLVVGTSMSAGKTTSAIRIVRALRRRGLRVAGAKLTGVARFHDILAMRDAGAERVFDFVDAGLPSTVCPADEFIAATRAVLSRVAAVGADVAVVEAGASPLEPYNGQLAIESLRPTVRFAVLCASDPYAVVGVKEAFGFEPDLVCGRATSTQAGVALVERLTGVPALDLLDAATAPRLAALLADRLTGGDAVGSLVRTRFGATP